MDLWSDPELEGAVNAVGRRARSNVACHFAALGAAAVAGLALLLAVVPPMRGLLGPTADAIDLVPGGWLTGAAVATAVALLLWPLSRRAYR